MLKVVLAKSYDAATGVINNSTSPWVAIETEYGSDGGLFCEAILYTYVFSENN